MNLENQVVSLQIAKKLKELGVKQESVFCWREEDFDGEVFWDVEFEMEIRQGHKIIQSISAFTVAELGEMLPNKDGWKITSVKQFDSQWECANRNLHGDGFEQYGETEADARGKMLIYLLENKLI